MPIAALFTKAKIWKQSMLPSTDEWIKMWHIYSIEYYSAMKKKRIKFCNNMDRHEGYYA